jgi:cytochrome b subunit of formate dehydrogenase
MNLSIRTLTVVIYSLWFLSFCGQAQENPDCFACHGDKSATGTRKGKTVSVYVDEKVFASSAHSSLACIQCHADLEKKDFPHDAPLKKVDCGTCHSEENKNYQGSFHGVAAKRGDPLAPGCVDCHGKHDIWPVKNPQSNLLPLRIPFLCGKCHREGTPVSRQREIPQDNILENFSESIHGEGLLKRGLSVSASCVSCHSAHQILPHTDPRSTIARKNIASTCAKCHAQIELVHRKIIRGELWEKEASVLPACVDCHQPHKVRKVFYDQGMANKDCLICHSKPDLKAAKDGRSLFVDFLELEKSRHGAKVSCSQCHAEVSPSLTRPCASITKKVDCGSCHAAMNEQYQKSTHGMLAAKNDLNAPTCKECHGKHGVAGRREAASPIFPSNIPSLCARCHREGAKAAVRIHGPEQQIVSRYTESIHGKGLMKSGLLVTATCTDCHTAHYELPPGDTASSVNPLNLPATCGRCHHGIQEQFVQSIHSKTVSKSDKKLPVCSNCHSAHSIRRADIAGFKLEIMATCGHCHEDISRTYFDTYHGKVTQLGYAKTAKCYDCHGAHDIQPVGDPRSHLSRQNVVQTCQKCHPGATRRFAGYLSHATHHDPAKYPVLFWVFWGMTSLVIGTFFFSGLHTLLWLPRAWQMRKHHREEKFDPHEKQFQRFTRLNRTLHITLVVSFISLAMTGMTLKFSYTGWAVIISRLFGGFEMAGIWHRFAALLMVGIFITHIYDLLRRKRKEYKTWKALLFGPDTMLPTQRDFFEVVGSIKWFLGLGPRPQYGRWTYWEKFDYFAVFWGVFVIGSTGFMLWFPEFVTRFLPGSLINVATIVHSDEALLAAGFIFTIHFFNTHLRPEKFPMDIVVFTGRMPVEEFKRDKPAEYEALVASGELDKYLVEPYPPIVLRAIRTFGWIALTLGFSMVIWIIYGMLFAYR